MLIFYFSIGPVWAILDILQGREFGMRENSMVAINSEISQILQRAAIFIIREVFNGRLSRFRRLQSGASRII